MAHKLESTLEAQANDRYNPRYRDGYTVSCVRSLLRALHPNAFWLIGLCAVMWGQHTACAMPFGRQPVPPESVQAEPPVSSSGAVYPDFTQIAKQYAPAVVNISTTRKSRARSPLEWDEEFGDSPYGDIFRRFFHGLPMEPREYQTESLGSGTVISTDGYILTNNHVIKDASEILVHLDDKREFSAKVVGTDESTDLALLKIKAKGLPSVKIGRSADIRVGEWVLAIGAPFGFNHSVTAGIVSGIHRSIGNERSVPFIQTDAAINPGNSGGPLFNLRGEVIGINAQILSKSGGYLGLSFSIPMDLAIDVAEQLKSHGRVTHGWLGIAFQEVDSTLAQSFGLDRPYGALVAQVVPQSPAAKAGIQTGDVVIRFNGREIAQAQELPQLVGPLRPGAKAELTLIRKRETRTVSVVIGENKQSEKTRNPAAGSGAPFNPLGFRVRALTAEEKRFYPNGGVAIAHLHPHSPLLRLGVRSGDILLAFDQKSLPSVQAWEEHVSRIKPGQVVSLLIGSHKGQMSRYIGIKWPSKSSALPPEEADPSEDTAENQDDSAEE